MKTIRLYQKDVYLNTFTAKVEDILTTDDGISVVLDQTAFFPEGGGQSSDIGTINNKEVTYVYEENDRIYHKIVSADFTIGDEVSCAINWPRRFENMQRHCGEHILTGVIYREFGGVNRGFHMGDEYMTIDISMEEDPEYKEMTWDMLLKAERMTNELIWENVPMIIRHFDKLEEAADIPVRKKVTVEEDITLVGIGSPENGWGCCACCGTHPAFTGQVGIVKVFKVEPNKGMYRIYFEAGSRAFEDYHKRFEVLSKISSKYSAGPDDVLDKLKSHEEKQKEIRSDYFALRQSVIKAKAKEIQEEINDGNVHMYTIEELKLDDIRNLAKLLDFKGLTIFCDRPSLTALLFAGGKVDCGKLIKDNAPVFSGKGGGRPDNAQAKFDKEENMYLFADAIEKILR